MLRIKGEQMAVFSEEAVKDFENRMIVHLRKFLPAHVEPLGDAQIGEFIRRGIERAASHGIVNERGVCSYVDGMFVFGRDFDTDPNLSWASAILGDRSLKGPTKAARLFDAMLKHLSAAPGITAGKTDEGKP